MKTFKEYTTDDTLSPFFYQYGGSILGPGMGQYHPTAALNLRAQKEREVRKSDLDQLERYADRLFASLGIDVEFTKHFLDRVNDERNVKQITPSELTRLFKQSYKKHGKTIAKLGPDAEAVVNDMKTDINMPFVLNLKGGELELVAKTVMRKKDFKTSNRKLSFESYTRKTIKVGEDSVLGDGNPHYALVSDRKVVAIGTKEEMLELSDSQKGRVWLTKSKVGDIVESRAKKAVAGGKVQKLVTAHGLKFKGKVYKEIDMELVKINNSTQMVTFNIIHPKELFGNETNISFRALRRGPFMATDTSKINEGIGEPNIFSQKNPRIPRKKGQPAKSKKHSDLYTDEDPVGTIHGLKFATVEDAEESVKKIENSDRTHAHKIQAAVAMEQRAREMGKTSAADVYRRYINKMKEKTKEMRKEDIEDDLQKTIEIATKKAQLKKRLLQMTKQMKTTLANIPDKEQRQRRSEQLKRQLQSVKDAGRREIQSIQKEDAHGFKCPSGYKFDRKLMACVPKRSRYKTVYAYPYFGGGSKSGDQSGQSQDGQNGNGNGNGNAQGGNGNGNGGNGNGGNGNGGGNGGGESYIVSDVRKMSDGGYGVYADKFVKGKRVMTPGGKHKKELKKVYRSKTKANKYMAAIMIGKGG